MRAFTRVINSFKIQNSVLAEEPRAPSVSTDIPGPRAKQLLATLSNFSQDTRSVNLK